jgi:large subunit ribosomal protein L9
MKVILTQDVPKIGQKDDIKDFNDGFAQNVLLSKGKAILATPKALADLTNRKAGQEKRRKEEDEIFSSMISSLNDKKITIKVKTNEKGNLFQSVTNKDISKAIKEQTGLLIEENNIEAIHLKQIGKHNVILKKGNLEGKCEIIIDSIN